MNEPKYPNSGILSKNKERDPTNENDREYQGSCDVTCPGCGRSFAHWLSAWVKDGQYGRFFKIKFKAKDQPQGGGQRGGGQGQRSSGNASQGGGRGPDDEIPF